MSRILTLFVCCLLSASTFATTRFTNIEHVIYITLDGVRWQEVYQDHQYFPNIWNHFKNELTFYGEPGSNTTMDVASIPVSLPSYQSQMTGAVQPCDGNGCGRVKVETLPEKLIREFHFKPKDVVMFATWTTMHDAYQSEFGNAFENVGNTTVQDPESGLADSIMSEQNMLQSVRPHHGSDRFDYFTISQAMHYFLKYQPKFMWISLADSDNYAHAEDLAGYHSALRLYDDLLAQLFETIRHLGIDDKTMIIVTTDHGRGNGDQWPNHGPSLPESKQTWAFVWHGQLKPVSEEGEMKHYSTLSIRPTIERVFSNAQIA